MKRNSTLALALAVALTGVHASHASPATLKLGSQQAYAGDEVKVDYKIVDKTKFGVTLENTATKTRTHLSADHYVWNGSDLSIKLPTNLQSGKYTVSLEQNGSDVAEAPLAVKVHPTVTSTNLEGVLPGQPVIVYGAGFSQKASDNVVEFTTLNEQVDNLGGSRYYDGPVATYRAVATDATDTSLTVVAPQEVADYVTSQVSAPTRVTVKVNGEPANGEAKIFLSIREWARNATSIDR